MLQPPPQAAPDQPPLPVSKGTAQLGAAGNHRLAGQESPTPGLTAHPACHLLRVVSDNAGQHRIKALQFQCVSVTHAVNRAAAPTFGILTRYSNIIIVAKGAWHTEQSNDRGITDSPSSRAFQNTITGRPRFPMRGLTRRPRDERSPIHLRFEAPPGGTALS